MNVDDVETIKGMSARLRALLPDPESIVYLSPEGGEAALVQDIWPGAGITEVRRDRWDLMDVPTGDIRGDLAVACNTFMCSCDPARWLSNIAVACPYLLIQDLCVARRGGAGRHCAPETGDVARYSFSAHGIEGFSDSDYPTFDISTSGHETFDVQFYGDGGVKFVALLRLRRTPA